MATSSGNWTTPAVVYQFSQGASTTAPKLQVSDGTEFNVTNPAWKTACAVGGHLVSEIIEYIDGVVVAYCEYCEQRIRLERVPGGIDLPQLRLLIETLVEQRGQVSDDLIWTVARVLNAIRSERTAVEEAEQLADVLAGLIDVRNRDVGES